MLIVPLTGTQGAASPALRQMLVYVVSSNAAAQRHLQELIEKGLHIFLQGEHVLFTAAYMALSSVQGYLVLILLVWLFGVFLGFFLVFILKDHKAL